jgi:peptidoglycan/LPS O-acetylase OafA/YrhL
VPEETEQNRFAALDGLRGLASFVILVLHYRFLTDRWNDALVQQNPFASQLIVLYKFGWLAVEFFFVLSGFIFFWKYGQRITDKAITLTEFAMLRLSRLYPLHFVTLFLVIPFQWAIFAKSGTTFFYANHDLFHLGLNLLFLNFGWFETSYSFNAPAWSIALEVGLYFLFYALCFGRRNRTLIALAGFLFFLTLVIRGPVPNMPFMNEHFARVGYCFFLGGLVHAVYEKLRAVPELAKLVGTLAMIPPVIALGMVHYVLSGHPEATQFVGVRMNLVLVLGVFPCLMLASLLQPAVAKIASAKPLQFLGDISYSMYMIHFSVLMAMHLLSLHSASGPWNFQELGYFTIYLSVVIGLSHLSFRHFERPMMKWLRKAWRESGAAVAVPAETVPAGQRVAASSAD